jgi:K+-sensing histidine kinase KdpD
MFFSFGTFYPVLVSCTKKNLAALLSCFFLGPEKSLEDSKSEMCVTCVVVVAAAILVHVVVTLTFT